MTECIKHNISYILLLFSFIIHWYIVRFGDLFLNTYVSYCFSFRLRLYKFLCIWSLQGLICWFKMWFLNFLGLYFPWFHKLIALCFTLLKIFRILSLHIFTKEDNNTIKYKMAIINWTFIQIPRKRFNLINSVNLINLIQWYLLFQAWQET